MPLVFGGEVTAVLVVSRRFDPAFNPADVSTLHLIGNVAVMAIRNARLYAAAEDALKARDDLLIAVAHELRTPLTITTGYLDLINDGSLGAIPEPLLDPLAEVTAKNAELRRLVEDLLNASSLGSGYQQRFPAIFDREPTDSRLSA
jgi:K+-sensing histidine kinase KdpD